MLKRPLLMGAATGLAAAALVATPSGAGSVKADCKQVGQRSVECPRSQLRGPRGLPGPQGEPGEPGPVGPIAPVHYPHEVTRVDFRSPSDGPPGDVFIDFGVALEFDCSAGLEVRVATEWDDTVITATEVVDPDPDDDAAPDPAAASIISERDLDAGESRPVFDLPPGALSHVQVNIGPGPDLAYTVNAIASVSPGAASGECLFRGTATGPARL